jgi:hypothetical protein
MFTPDAEKDYAMKPLRLQDMNNERFLKEAFDPEANARWTRAVRFRRNVYLSLFLTGMVCLLITAITHQAHMSLLSLLLATCSLVITSKYDTQLQFLTKLKLRPTEEEEQLD